MTIFLEFMGRGTWEVDENSLRKVHTKFVHFPKYLQSSQLIDLPRQQLLMILLILKFQVLCQVKGFIINWTKWKEEMKLIVF